jgi:hypothetical protein
MSSQERADKNENEKYSRGVGALIQGVRWQQRDHLLTTVQPNEFAEKDRQKRKKEKTHEVSSR